MTASHATLRHVIPIGGTQRLQSRAGGRAGAGVEESGCGWRASNLAGCVAGDGGGKRSPLLLPGTAHSAFLAMAASASSMALLGFPHGAGGTRGGEASVASRDRESRDPKAAEILKHNFFFSM